MAFKKVFKKYFEDVLKTFLTPRSLEGGFKLPPPLNFFGFKVLLLDRLSKALAQLFFVCEHIF